MNKTLRTILLLLIAVVIVLVAGPFLIPVTPLTDTVSPLKLAQEDSHFLTIRFQGTNGVDLHYRERGSGQPAFILLHAFGGNVYTWDPVLDEFGTDGYTVAYDRIPFGLSERIEAGRWSGENPYTLEAAVAQLVGLLDKLGLEKAVLVGHSAGGVVALKMAIEYPERVEALILVDPTVYSDPGVTPLASLSGLPQVDHLGPLTSRSLKASLPQLIKQSFHDPDRFVASDAEQMQITFQATDWDKALWEYVKAQRMSDVAQRLGEVNTPTLIVIGDDDRVVPLSDYQKLEQAISGAKLVTISEAGHLPFVEQPDEFMKAVDAWLKEQGLID